ncbi:MAG: aminopeptidase PepB [Succinatimonas hippei]|nr:aminopeptidase PepB [Succinatimonas hippei]
MFKLLSVDSLSSLNVVINLKEGKAQAPFEEDAKFTPNENGYTVYIDTKDFRWYQKAARVIAKLNIYNFSVISVAPFKSLELFYFLMALHDGKHDYYVAVEKNNLDLQEIENRVNLVCSYREIADLDSKYISPVKLVQTVYELIRKTAASNSAYTKLTLIDNSSDEFDSLVGLKTVGLASDKSPCLGIIDYAPNEQAANSQVDIALVGKGITFDTGGYSLKPDKYMETMRTDKSAAVYLAGALHLAISKGLNKHVRLYLCCSENMVSGKGMLPGDIIEYPNGIKVEINNTDAEGRLVLADGLLRAQKDGALEILDMATLTGAAKVAVGRDLFCVMTPNNKMNVKMQEAFDATLEMYWQLPMLKEHKRFLSSRRADLTNSGHGDSVPGASAAAAFLREFVDKAIPWTHIDLSSAYLPDESPFLGAGPTGSTILGIAAYLRA